MANKELKYLIIKETYSYKFCSVCGGAGKTTRTFRGHKFTDTCTRCGGTTRERLIHRTEVPATELFNHFNIKYNE